MGHTLTADPNTVEIHQSGCNDGFGANLGFLFAGKEPFPMTIDPRLAAFLTPAQYQDAIGKCNDTLKQEQKRIGCCCIVTLISLVVLIILSAIFRGMYEPEIVRCGAASVQCENHQINASQGDCCNWYCCEGNFIDPNRSGCAPIDAQPNVNHGCDCRTVDTGSRGRELDKKIVCGNIVFDGEREVVPEQQAFAGFLAVMLVLIGCCCCAGNILTSCVKACRLSGKLMPHLEPWRSKGLGVSYSSGNHSRAGIIVKLPPGVVMPMQTPMPVMQSGVVVVQGQVLGLAQPQAVGAQTMQVQIPPDAPAGSTIQVQAPTGQPMQIQVPEGVVAGSVVTVKHEAAV